MGTMGTGAMRGLLLVVALAAAAGPGAAQEIVASVGAASYDLSGVGTSWTASARYQHRLPGPFLLEAGATLFGYESQAADRRTFLMPEVGAGVGLPAGPVAVVFTVGGGISTPVQGNDETKPTLFAGLALELPSAGRVAVHPGVRYRAVDPWVGTVFEYTLGVRIGLGR